MDPMNENSSQASMEFEEAPDQELIDKFARKEPTIEMSRLLFYSHLSCAMKHRENFYEQDISDIRNTKDPTTANLLSRRTQMESKMSVKKLRTKYEDMIKVAIRKMARVGEVNQEEINDFMQRLDEANRWKFNNTSAFLLECSEEILLASDKQEVLMLLKMYNNNDLDLLFTEYREQKAKLHEKTDPSPAQ